MTPELEKAIDELRNSLKGELIAAAMDKFYRSVTPDWIDRKVKEREDERWRSDPLELMRVWKAVNPRYLWHHGCRSIAIAFEWMAGEDPG